MSRGVAALAKSRYPITFLSPLIPALFFPYKRFQNKMAVDMPRLWITLRVTHQPLGQPCGLTTYPRASRTTKAFSFDLLSI
jgi:hypothetical protein